MVSRLEIIKCARLALGTSFHHQGRQPGVGLDCVGLVIWVGQSLGLTDFDILNYPRLPQGDQLREVAEQAGFVPVPQERPGDIACFRLGRNPQHVGILTGHGLIHACQNVGRVIEHRLDEHWRRRIISIFKFPGLV